MPGPYSMLGYNTARGPRPFFKADVTTDSAKVEAAAEDLERFLLIPHGPLYQHRAYIRRAPGEHEQMLTRPLVFKHLLTTDTHWIPTPEEVEIGKRLQRD